MSLIIGLLGGLLLNVVIIGAILIVVNDEEFDFWQCVLLALGLRVIEFLVVFLLVFTLDLVMEAEMAETLASYLALPIVAACFGFLITYVVGIEVPKAILSSVIYFVLLIGLQFVLSILFTSVDANATAMLSRL